MRKAVNPYNVQGISFESEDFLKEAKDRAESLGLSLSAYVCAVVRNDLASPGEIRLRPRTYPAPANPNPQLNEPPAPYDTGKKPTKSRVDLVAEKGAKKAIQQLKKPSQQ